MVMLLMLYSALCAAPGRPMRQIASSTLRSMRIFLSCKCHGMPWEPWMHRTVSTALTTWLATVAMAAPATPSGMTATSTISSTMLTMEATIKKYSGRLESPTARRMLVPML